MTRTTWVAFVSFLLGAALQYIFARLFVVRGTSMEPALSGGQLLVVNTRSYRHRVPDRGDIVVLRDPRQPSRVGVKRVVGLPGERVLVDGDNVTINAHQSTQDDAVPSTARLQSSLVPPDHVFVLGDNLEASTDSRVFGPVPRTFLIGHAWLRMRRGRGGAR